MMNFSEYLTINPNLYQNINIDEPTKQSIYDWFQFREVCDDTKFGVYFRRLLNTTLIKYDQLLRIEPGISQYDWLVQHYMERQDIIQEKEKGKENIQKNNDITNQYQDNQNGNIEDDLTRRGSNTTTDTLGAKRTITNDLTNTNKTAFTKGAQTDTNKDVYDGTRRTDIHGNDINIVDTKIAEKLLPMESVNIPENDINVGEKNYGKGLGNLDWTAATSQRQDTSTNVAETASTNGEQDQNTRDITTLQGQRIDNTESTVKDTGTQSTQDSGSNVSDITFNSGENNVRTIGLHNNGNNIQENRGKEDKTKEIANLKINQLQYSGRQKEIAKILQEATEYIKNSCAFDYLRKELEVVFMHVIDW